MQPAQFRYRVLDASGHRRTGTLRATDRGAARSRLRDQGYYVLDLTPKAGRPWSLSELANRQRRSSRRLSVQLADLTRQLSTLLRAGVPLAHSLGTLSPEISDARLRQIVEGLRLHVTEGRSLAAALEEHPGVFDTVYVALVRAGETTGTLDESLERLSGYLSKRLQLRDKIVSALAYPALVVLVGVLVSAFLVNFVVPKVLSVLEGTGRPLPLPTRMLLGISDLTSAYWPVGVVLMILGAIGLGVLGRNEAFRVRWDRFQLKVPVYGALLVKQLVARLSGLMAALLGAGIPMGQALQLAGQASTNRVLAGLLERARHRVAAGSSLAEGLDGDGVVPRTVVQMLLVGQQGGQLPEMFQRVSEDYQREVDVAADRFTALLEPILIVCLAVVVGFIVLATMLPILELTSSLQTKGGMP